MESIDGRVQAGRGREHKGVQALNSTGLSATLYG
jgi:hypothetical protein